MSRLLAIDPGNIESGWVLLDVESRRPIEFDKTDNHDLREALLTRHPSVQADHLFVEMIAAYGMPVGAEVFETCVWIGRFAEAARRDLGEAELVKRREVKLHHCYSSTAKDSNVRQALVDRFATGQPNYGKGTKADPGWFHGFRADVWQAYALAVYAADTQVSS